MRTVSLVGVRPSLGRQIEAELQAADLQVVAAPEATVADELRLRPDAIDAVVIAETEDDLLRVAQRMRAVDSAVGIVLVAASSEHARDLADRTQVTPFLGRNTQVAQATAPQVLSALRRVMDEAAKIRCNRTIVEAARVRTAGLSPSVEVATPEDLSALVEELPVGVLTVDGTGRILECNRRAAQLLGVPLATMAGTMLEQPLAPLSREPLRTLLADHGNLTPPLTLSTQEGSSLAVTVRALSRRPAGHLLAVLQDETARLQAERENFSLQVAMRAAEDRLREAQKMEALGRLSGGIAHDFNNLLTAILAFANLALEELEPAHPAAVSIREVVRAGERAAGVTAQLLAVARRQVLQPKRQRLDDVVRDVATLLRRLIGANIELVLRTEAPGAWVDVDAGQMQQVLMNLAVNARDAMPEGGTLTIVTALEAGEAFITVVDTGRGMDETTRLHMFEPFFTTKPFGQGTGLGLSVVDGILAQSGGRITVESEIDHGSTFRIALPARLPGQEAEAPACEPRPSGGSETVLVVDDEPAVLQVTKAALVASGYRVVMANSGAEGLEQLKQHGEVKLLLTDVMMPRMGGVELARQALALRPALKVVFMSGYSASDALQGMAIAGSDFLAKPFAVSELRGMVRTALDREAVTVASP